MDPLADKKQSFEIGLVGCGVLGENFLKQLIQSGFRKNQFIFTEKNKTRAEYISIKYNVRFASIEEVSKCASNVILVVKPVDSDDILNTLMRHLSKEQRIISFVAGKKTSTIESHFAFKVPVLRVMPNIPISVGVGISAISKGKYATDEDVKAVQELLKASGKTIVVDESLQDAVTATSGSGPAYFFRFVEAMIAGAQDLGLSESDARTMVIQTITGAAAMLNQEGANPGVLRQNVTSPNGTTYAALQVFEGGHLEGLVKRAMKAARDRSQELS